MRAWVAVIAIGICLLLAPSAFGCTCPAGQVEVNGKCVVPTPPPTPVSGNSTSSSTSNSNSTSSSASSSDAHSTATGGNATATGGNATQSQRQSASASASNNGNGSNNSSYTNNENVAASKIPVSTAYAPTVGATVTCFKPFGIGGQSMVGGVSFGSGRIDAGCDAREFAREFYEFGSSIAACKASVTAFLKTKVGKKSGVTVADCLNANTPPQPVVAPQQIQPIDPAPVAVAPDKVNPVAIVATSANQDTAPQRGDQSTLVGVCSYSRGLSCAPNRTARPSTVAGPACRKMLDAVVRAMQMNEDASIDVFTEGSLSNVVSAARVNGVVHYLIQAGVDRNRIQTKALGGPQEGNTVELWLNQ